MKIFVLVACIFMFSLQVIGQTRQDSIEVKKGFSTTFRHNGQNLTPKQMLDLTRSNPEAYKEMQIAKSKAGISSVLGFAGGALVGFPLGTAIGGGEANWSLVGIGAGLIAIGIPFSVAYTKHATNAARIYNNGSTLTGMRTKTEFKVGAAGNGIGFQLAF